MSEVEAEISMFERIGGAVVIDRLVEAFYRRMDALPEARTIRAMHAPDSAPGKCAPGDGPSTASSKGKEEGTVPRAAAPPPERRATQGGLCLA